MKEESKSKTYICIIENGSVMKTFEIMQVNGPHRLGVGVRSLLASESLDNVDEPKRESF